MMVTFVLRGCVDIQLDKQCHFSAYIIYAQIGNNLLPTCTQMKICTHTRTAGLTASLDWRDFTKSCRNLSLKWRLCDCAHNLGMLRAGRGRVVEGIGLVLAVLSKEWRDSGRLHMQNPCVHDFTVYLHHHFIFLLIDHIVIYICWWQYDRHLWPAGFISVGGWQ